MNHSRIISFICSLISAIGLSGCAGTFTGGSGNLTLLRPALPPNDARVRTLVTKYSNEDAIEAFYRYGVDEARVVGADGKTVTVVTTYRDLKSRRNKIIFDLIFVINDYYDKYELARYATVTGSNFAGDVITSGLDAASTAVGGAGVKTILSAISTGVGATKAAAQRDFLQSQNISLLIQKMRVLRGEVYTRIQTKLVQSVDVYPLEAALIDLQDYFHAGTLIGAMQALANDTGAAKLVNDASDPGNAKARALATAAGAVAEASADEPTASRSTTVDSKTKLKGSAPDSPAPGTTGQ